MTFCAHFYLVLQLKEFFSRKNDSSLFMFGSHSKKRPNNIVIGKLKRLFPCVSCIVIHVWYAGRLFNYQVLDMIELGVENYKSRQSFKVGQSSLLEVLRHQFFLVGRQYSWLKTLFNIFW